MTYDPYEEAGLRRDLAKTEPQRVDLDDRQANIWLPLVIVIALLVVIGYTFYDRGGSPNSRADSTAITKSEPSPN